MTRGTAAADSRAGDGTDGRARERGFTMVEMVVVIAIITLLAAVILPQVASQQTSANPAAVGSELRNLQTAAEMFQVDIRVTAGGISDLSRDIGRDSLGTINDLAYTGTEVDRWQGPCLDQPVEAIGSAMSTDLGIGFGSDLCNDFFIVSAASTTDEGWTTSGNGSASECQDFENTTNGEFAAVVADSVNLRNFEMIDDAVDDGDGPDFGKVRLMGADDDNLLVFLLIPVLPSERGINRNP